MWGERNNVPVISQKTGSDSASVIYDAIQSAKAKNIDLIIVGAHGARGIKKIIGSTAQSVLNNASCDVLAVRKMK